MIEATAMGPERSKPLHNFSMPYLKWGHQRFLRCVKVTADEPPMFHHRRSSSQPDPPLGSKRKATTTASNDIDSLSNIDAVRQKLMVDLKVAADKLKVSIFEEGVANNTTTTTTINNNNTNNPRPWNLRTRRAACKAPPPPPQHREEQPLKNLDYVPETAIGVARENLKSVEQKKIGERPKFSVSLSKAEVEQDFWALVGTRPPRRPKKRPRIVQRQLDTLFPGLWLSEVTAESYKVPDVPE